MFSRNVINPGTSAFTVGSIIMLTFAAMAAPVVASWSVILAIPRSSRRFAILVVKVGVVGAVIFCAALAVFFRVSHISLSSVRPIVWPILLAAGFGSLGGLVLVAGCALWLVRHSDWQQVLTKRVDSSDRKRVEYIALILAPAAIMEVVYVASYVRFDPWIHVGIVAAMLVLLGAMFWFSLRRMNKTPPITGRLVITAIVFSTIILLLGVRGRGR